MGAEPGYELQCFGVFIYMFNYGQSKKGENCVCKQYVTRISVCAAVSLIETVVNCTAAFNIHFAAIF